MRQSDLEQEMVDLGKHRYWSKVNRARELEIESTTGVGQRLLSESVINLSKALKSWMKEAEDKPGKLHRAHEYLAQIPTKVTAAITARCILDSISHNRKITSTSIHIARLLEDELKFRHIKNNEPALWQHINRVMDKQKSYATKSKFIKKTAKYNDVIVAGWPKKDALSVGLVCTELMRQSTGLIDIVTRTNRRGRSVTLVRPTAELMEWIKNSHAKSELLKPVLLPMIEPPVDWKNIYGGGYVTDVIKGRSLVKVSNRKHLEEIKHADMPKVYKALNAIQRTGYRVNVPLIDVMKHFWERGVSVGGLPSVENTPVPTKPIDIDTNRDARRSWRKEAARIHFDNERQQSKRLQVAKVLYLANKFSGQTLAYPHQLDFRGRAYPLPYYLQPQGPDFAKAGLEFAKGMAIKDDNAVAWLVVHLANGWGMDKDSFNNRVAWVEENERMLTAIATDPYRNMEWTDADNPWMFLAAAFDWKNFKANGMGYESHLPVGQDATTQGLQIYALLLRDEIAGHSTNCLPREQPGDPYCDVSDETIELLKASDHEYANKWLEFGIDRKTSKRQTMTLPYGSTFYSCKNYTSEWFYDMVKKGKENPFGEETYRPCTFLADLVWQSIGKVVGSARVGMDWLREVAATCVDNDVTVRWVTPLGFPVIMDYPKTSKYDVKTTIGQVVRQHRLRTPTEETDRRKTINAVAPNFVHSIDGLGGLLGETINLLLEHEVRDVQTVHDSCLVHAANAAVFSACVREATVRIFEEDLLSNFRNQVMHSLPSGVQLPDVPEMGSLDPKLVRESEYYWN